MAEFYQASFLATRRSTFYLSSLLLRGMFCTLKDTYIISSLSIPLSNNTQVVAIPLQECSKLVII